MTNPTELRDWPAGSGFALCRPSGDAPQILVSEGDLECDREWASVTKLAVSLAVAVECDRGDANLDQAAGPEGCTLAHLLAHASGLGLDAADPSVPVGTRRVYSNVGIDEAVRVVTGPSDPGPWLKERVFEPLEMRGSRLSGRASSGGFGPLSDLVRLGFGWLAATLVGEATQRRFTHAFMPELGGIVPGFGRFNPCPWGLGPEIHGSKNHWMGTISSPSSFGHFGQSGAFVLVDPLRELVLVAAAGSPFGPWARAYWPSWVDGIFERYGTK